MYRLLGLLMMRHSLRRPLLVGLGLPWPRVVGRWLLMLLQKLSKRLVLGSTLQGQHQWW